MSSTASPTRRVLGEKDANASFKILSPRSAGKPQADPAALLSPLGRISMTHPSPQIPSPSPRAGQKRRISEVDGVENEDRRYDMSASQQTVAISDVGSEDANPQALSAATTELRDSGPDTSLTSFRASQQDDSMMETQFELPADEMSQSTLEKMHEVALPQNSSQPDVHPARPRFRTEDSHVSCGMSSFVDFGGSEPSQASDRDQPIADDMQQGTQSNISSVSEEEQKKAFMAKKAADLRTRLQFAYFKVQTNQTTTPFSRLKVPESMKKVPWLKLSPPPRSTSTIATETSNLEERIFTARARATGQTIPAVHSLNDLPMPKLSAIPQPRAQTQNQNQNQNQNMPSSPPLSHSADPEDISLIHPRSQSHTRRPRTPSIEQLSSPPPSQHSHSEDEETPKPIDNPGHNPPSSAIKGEVADSLLQLMRGGSKDIHT